MAVDASCAWRSLQRPGQLGGWVGTGEVAEGHKTSAGGVLPMGDQDHQHAGTTTVCNHRSDAAKDIFVARTTLGSADPADFPYPAAPTPRVQYWEVEEK